MFHSLHIASIRKAVKEKVARWWRAAHPGGLGFHDEGITSQQLHFVEGVLSRDDNVDGYSAC